MARKNTQKIAAGASAESARIGGTAAKYLETRPSQGYHGLQTELKARAFGEAT